MHLSHLIFFCACQSSFFSGIPFPKLYLRLVMLVWRNPPSQQRLRLLSPSMKKTVALTVKGFAPMLTPLCSPPRFPERSSLRPHIVSAIFWVTCDPRKGNTMRCRFIFYNSSPTIPPLSAIKPESPPVIRFPFLL